MKFRKVKRPVLQQEHRTAPKVVRTQACVCPWCGAIESLRANRTKREEGRIIRYSTCSRCGKPVTRVLILPVKA